MSILSVINGSVLISRVRPALSFSAPTLVLASTVALPIVMYAEARWRNVALFIASFVFLFGLLRLLWLGPVLSALLSFTAMGGIYGASKFKFWLTGRMLNVWAIFTYVHLDTLIYIKDLYPQHYSYLYAFLALVLILAIAILWFEKLRRPSRLSAASFVILLLYGVVASSRGLFIDDQHPSTFILSFVESLPELVTGRVFEYGKSIPLDPQQVAAARTNRCSAPSGANYPNVIVILRESIVIPSTVQGMRVPQVDESRFASSDGRTYR